MVAARRHFVPHAGACYGGEVVPSLLHSVIGLGGNIEPREGYLAKAVERLARLGRLMGVSPLYESTPFGGGAQDNYFNAAVELHYWGDPLGLLSELLGVECDLGRVRRERWGPRSIDLDVLWIRDLAVAQSCLVVPHPWLEVRTFALLPLLDLIPDARCPVTGREYAVVASGLDRSNLLSCRTTWAGTRAAAPAACGAEAS